MMKDGANMENTEQEWPPIFYAIADGKKDEVKRLIEEGADIRQVFKGWSPLKYANLFDNQQIKDLLKNNDVGVCPECNGNTFTVDDYGINMNMLIIIENSKKVKVKLDNFNHDYLVCNHCDTAVDFNLENIKEIEVDFKF